MFNKKKKASEEEPPPLPHLKEALRLDVEFESELKIDNLLFTRRELLIEWSNGPTGCGFILQTVLVLVIFVSGVFLTFNALFSNAYAAAGADPTETYTPIPPLPTRTTLPAVTITKTPWPTSIPEARGKALADIYTSSFDGYDNRFGTKLMGPKADFEEYLLCFNGHGLHRHLDGLEEAGFWGTWEAVEGEDGFCIPGIFYSVTSASEILITSDVLHSIGLSEAEWLQIDTQIYEHGTPPNYWIFCPMGKVTDTSKFCVRDNGQ